MPLQFTKHSIETSVTILCVSLMANCYRYRAVTTTELRGHELQQSLLEPDDKSHLWDCRQLNRTVCCVDTDACCVFLSLIVYFLSFFLKHAVITIVVQLFTEKQSYSVCIMQLAQFLTPCIILIIDVIHGSCICTIVIYIATANALFLWKRAVK